MSPLLLIVIPTGEKALASIRARFDVIYAPQPDVRDEAIRTRGGEVRAVLTHGSAGLSAAQMEALPALSIVCALGAGYENIDIAHARSRGIVVANGAGTNDDCVADHAFALLLAVVRAIPVQDDAVRAGLFRDRVSMRPNFSHKKLGILGLGTIGRKIAKRGLGFDLEIGYHNRARQDVPHAYFDSAHALAEWADYLVVATPGGAATRHLVGREVLDALGPNGFLVNIARGSVVDTAALADALRARRIAGAGLDVYDTEPAPPSTLLEFENVVITPHMAGGSPEAVGASIARFIENATRHFAGEAPVSPVS